MIATLAEIKTLLQISDTSKDDLINMLIPIVENDIIEYTNNFKNGLKIITTTNCTFINESNTITVNNSFLSGQMIYVKGSQLNDGVYTINSRTDTTLTINSLYTLQDEIIDTVIEIFPLIIPKDIKLAFVSMINYKLSKTKDNVKAESIGDYSATFNNAADDTLNGYPKNIMKGLNKYRKIRWL